MDKSKDDPKLKDEYLYIQSVIHDFDGRALTIKTWSVSFSLAAIGVAFTSKSIEILFVSAISALLFWLVEGVWKNTQLAFYERSNLIEDYFAGNTENIVPFQIGQSWLSNYRKKRRKRLIKIMLYGRVWLPHLPVSVFSFTVFVLTLLGIIKL